jgi:hypothetical protein
MAPVLIALGLNIAAFFYLQAWLPLVNLYRAYRQMRLIRAFRVAGLLLLLLAVNVIPVQAQSVQRDGDWNLAQTYSHGDDALIGPNTTGNTTLDKTIRYVWDNAGKLTLIFALLAGAYLLIGKLEQPGETYGDVLRQEAAERWEEEQGDDIHNPFNSPEGMQPTTQYVPVRTRRS